MHILAGAMSYPRRSLLKSADMLDRVLRAESKSAQQKDLLFIQDETGSEETKNISPKRFPPICVVAGRNRFTRKLGKNSLGGEVNAPGEMVDHMSSLR